MVIVPVNPCRGNEWEGEENKSEGAGLMGCAHVFTNRIATSDTESAEIGRRASQSVPHQLVRRNGALARSGASRSHLEKTKQTLLKQNK